MNKWSPTLFLTIALTLSVIVQQHQLAAERTRAADLALSLSNGIAQRDSTHRVALENQKVVSMLGDTLQLFAKKVVQAKQQRDALDHALRTERIARYAMVSMVDSLRRDSVTAPTQTIHDGVRRAVFNVRDEPYDVHAEVEMPSVPDTARLSVRVRLDPVRLNVRLSCGTTDANGIRGATITAESPRWAAVRFDQVEQSPDLCASPALLQRASSAGIGKFTPLVLGAGRVIGANGMSSWGVFVGAGMRLTR
jgi:hypothetical protein